MSFFDVETRSEKSQKSNAKVLGSILTIASIALIAWYVADVIYDAYGIRAVIYGDMLSISRLVIGVVGVLAGLIVMKNEDWSTIKP